MTEQEYYGYKVQLSNFEGPLDLLLHLVRIEKIDIKDIFISKVTDEYLNIVFNSGQEDLDMENVSDFIDVAATLVEIKSRSLLPKEKEELDEDDPQVKLIRQLEEYKLFKDASLDLRKIENTDSFYKEVSPEVGKIKTVILDMTMESLIKAFSSILIKVKSSATPVEPKQVNKEKHTVQDQATYIRSTLKREKKVSFFNLFKDSSTKEECIVTFLALLELLRLNIVKSSQESYFSDIIIEYKDEQQANNNGSINIDIYN